jgi:hypothetical protein
LAPASKTLLWSRFIERATAWFVVKSAQFLAI